MRRTVLAVLVVVCLAAGTRDVRAARAKTNQLLSVITPVARTTAVAHPHVNVVVRFATTREGHVPDPATFRARLGRQDVTSRFRPIVEGGATVGMRAELLPPALKVGRRAANRLRFDLRSRPRSGPPPRIVRDVDKVRFKAAEAANQPPVAAFALPDDIIVPETPLQFDGTASHDPDLDELTYEWDFGDGGTATEARPTHPFTAGVGEVTVRLTVRDGALAATDSAPMIECPPADAGRTPGILRVEAAGPLEFGAVAPGASGSKSFTVRNTDPTPTSQVKVQMRVDSREFAADPATLDLGPGDSATVALSFAPGAEGHRSADVVLLATATNRCALHLLAHGYGGTAPGTGPTSVASPLFYNGGFGGPIAGILPSGAPFETESRVHVCQSPNNGPGTGDVCMADGDCAANGGTCNTSVATFFDRIDMCTDGGGSLYLLSDEGTYTDPAPGLNDLGSSILRIDVDENGTRSGARVLARVNSGSTQIACDRQPGGRLFLAEFRNVDAIECFRSEQEALVPLRRGTGIKDAPLLTRLDAATGLTACEDDIDPLADLQVSPDGTVAYAAFEDAGLYQIRPVFRPIAEDIREPFRLHPAGDIVYVIPASGGSVLNVYRISPQQAATGMVRLGDLAPCGVLKVPTNRLRNAGFLTYTEQGFTVGRAATGSADGTLLVSFVATGGLSERPSAFSPELQIRGMAAFSLPADSSSCSALGIIRLGFAEYLTL